MNPFLVLNVPLGCSDNDVRLAYQALLRRFPPEGDPIAFQAIQEAYAALRTERDRWNCHLLRHEPPGDDPLQVLERFARLPGRARPPGSTAFKTLLRSCVSAAQRAETRSQGKHSRKKNS